MAPKRDRNKEEEPSMEMYLPLGESASSFNLAKAVCNHGFFMMAPNLWIPSTKTLERPLRLSDAMSVIVRVSHPRKHDSLRVLVLGTNSLSPQDQQVLLVKTLTYAQVARMLRISKEDERKLREFHKIHSRAKKKGFGSVFRSPSLFEDLVKSMLLCNCRWKRTLDMAKALCDLQLALNGGSDHQKGKQSISKMIGRREPKRKNVTNEAIDINNEQQQMVSYTNSLERRRQYGNFPSSKELANLDEEELERKNCYLGYRAFYILELAKRIETGEIKLENHNEDDYDKLIRKLKCIKGVGSFTCDNVLMCLGFYERVPIDTETVRHLQEFHGRKDCTIRTAKKYISKIYGKYAPFQCLAYWLELLEFYEKKFGKLSQMPHSNYYVVTGAAEVEKLTQ
ncbi:hypothetical protein NE237_015796 [Protea cynaroides]|uniref:DNA-(apurinic or apyrimidinic site) lyase n=1 Tax=Protea cynaroides TaxID=273540 RepID=A0A9Q0KEQ2_9MAGN|nr:hypothetical protein NE237_015796 [Protea cynaroides]